MINEEIRAETVGRFDHILTLNHQAYMVEQYETAYCLLAATLHSAYEFNDLERLVFIETLAAAQGKEIDADMPKHPFSTSSAKARGHLSLFRALAIDARHRQVLLRSK